MVNLVRERNFNFQNVKLYISTITKRGSSNSGYIIGISDESSFFVSGSFQEKNNIEINATVDSGLLELLLIESDTCKAIEKAVDLIGRSEQSSGGLFLKLKKRGFCDLACRDAVSKVVLCGLLNDERFSEMWIHSRLRKHPEGKSNIYSGLLSRGVPTEIAGIAIEKYLTEENLLTAVVKVGVKISKKYKDSPQKIKNALYRRGFTNREINFFLENDNV